MMERRIHLYVSRRNVAAWLMVLCMLCSAGTRVVAYWGSADERAWGLIVLPALAALLYAVITIWAGNEMFYKTALPVWLLGLNAGVQFFWQLEAYPVFLGMICICILFFCMMYTIITSGRLRLPWLLLPLYLTVLAAIGYVNWQKYLAFLPADADRLKMAVYLLPDYLMVLGMLVLLFAIKVHTDGNYHPTWGDRTDGRRIRSTPALDQLAPYIMVDRNSSNNLFGEAVEATEMERYIRRKRKEGLRGFGIMHVVIAAYVRTVAKYPALNRFVAGQKVYSRGEDIALCMTVKKEMSTSSPDTVIKVHLDPRDTAADVYHKYNAQLEEAKKPALDSGVDNTAGILTLIPGLALKFVVWLLKAMDYLGLVPGFLLEISPFHGSIYFTSMGSLGISPVYHHLYDFGTIPVFCAFGGKRRVSEIVDGQAVEKKYIDLKFNLDERICDGYYYATAIRHFLWILRHPDTLDQTPEMVEKDVP